MYFEAGIAMGLGVPVIWTCRNDDIANLHFDIRQYNCISWTKLDNLVKQLQKRILRVVGKGRFRTSPRGLSQNNNQPLVGPKKEITR